jgi:multimeric flavodoxin WrbA
MRVVAIVGSPRKNGNTEILAAHTLKAIAEEGIETELISLAGKDIRPCNACMACAEKEQCSIQDALLIQEIGG